MIGENGFHFNGMYPVQCAYSTDSAYNIYAYSICTLFASLREFRLAISGHVLGCCVAAAANPLPHQHHHTPLPPLSANRSFYVRMLDSTNAKNHSKYQTVHFVGYLLSVPPVTAAQSQPGKASFV